MVEKAKPMMLLPFIILIIVFAYIVIDLNYGKYFILDINPSLFQEPRILLEDDFSSKQLNESKWGIQKDIRSCLKIVNESAILYHTCPGGVDVSTTQGVTLFSKRSDLNDGILEFDYKILAKGSCNMRQTAVVVNFNHNGKNMQRPCKGIGPGVFCPDNGYRLRIIVDRGVTQLDVFNNSHVIEKDDVMNPNHKAEMLEYGHLKIVKNNLLFTVYYNGEKVSWKLAKNFLPLGRVGFSVSCMDSGTIEIDNVSFRGF